MTAPFGIEFHVPLPNESKTHPLGGNKFEIVPPRPHPSFHSYYAQDSGTFGTVWLKGVSSQVENDAYGHGVRGLMDRVSTQLETRYGRPKKVDLLHAGSIWDEPRDWVASMHENNRSFFHAWNSGETNLPDDLTTVFLSIVTYSHDDAAVILEYVSSKHEQAEREQDDDLAGLL